MSAAVSTDRGVPAIRVERGRDNSLSVSIDDAEWHSRGEAADLAAWLMPVVQLCVDHDEIARAIGAPQLTPERIAAELARTAACLLLPGGGLRRQGRRWRFTGGLPPHDPLDDGSAS